MVLSKLNNKISYPETKSVNADDLDKEVSLYQLDLDTPRTGKIDIIIAVGKEKKTFEDKNVTFFPVYMVKSNKKVIQIGVYEILSSKIKEFTDKKGQLDVEKMDDPLVYKFVTRDMLKNLRLLPELYRTQSMSDSDSDSESESGSEPGRNKDQTDLDDEIPDVRKDVFVLTKGFQVPRLLKEETRKEAKDTKEKFRPDGTTVWVDVFMSNNNYYIVDNEGGGDCLFAAIRDAFDQIGQRTTVAKLRARLAEEATETLFMSYKERYDDAQRSVVSDTKLIKELQANHTSFKEKFQRTLDREQRKKLAQAGTEIQKEVSRLSRQKKISQDIMNEFEVMHNIDDLAAFQKAIRTCQFWGDTWALSTLERVLNIKFILLSSEAYGEGDLVNVLNCGQLNDSVLQEKGVFDPEYYIMLDYVGYHYKLVGYKKKQIFKFQELPFDMKERIVNKCLERNAGAFSLIPDFVKFKEELKGASQDKPRFEELSEAKIKGLYDEDVVFSFYSGSNGKRLPGRGAGEKVPQEAIRDYADLAGIKDWRKKLDNEWVQEFTLDGHRWLTVEHFLQASKFKQHNREFYLSFTVESGTPLSKDAEMARDAGSKKGKHKGELIRPVEVTPDPEFNSEVEEKALKEAIHAKFSQNEDLGKMLEATKRAKLVYCRKCKEPKLAEELISVRDQIKR